MSFNYGNNLIFPDHHGQIPRGLIVLFFVAFSGDTFETGREDKFVQQQFVKLKANTMANSGDWQNVFEFIYIP